MIHTSAKLPITTPAISLPESFLLFTGTIRSSGVGVDDSDVDAEVVASFDTEISVLIKAVSSVRTTPVWRLVYDRYKEFRLVVVNADPLQQLTMWRSADL